MLVHEPAPKRAVKWHCHRPEVRARGELRPASGEVRGLRVGLVKVIDQ